MLIFIVIWIKMRETKQKVIALVATTFKSLLSVTKASAGLCGRKLYAGNIYCFLWKLFAHISPYQPN